MKKIVKTKNEYNRLKSDLENIISKGRARLEKAATEIAVETHWQAGRRLHESLGESRTESSGELIEKLAQDLGVHNSVLYRSLQFFRKYPERLPDTDEFRSLSWGAHVELLPVNDEEERVFYITRAAQEKWSREKLRGAIRADEYAKREKGKKKNRDVELERPKPGLYTYEAELERVIDGDTIIVRVDLGFDVLKRERIRFRSVDAPPLETTEGEKAMRFVKKALKNVKTLVLRTHWHDMYGRYVADVLYDKKEESKDRVLKKGRFLNQELLDSGMAVFRA